jgi:tetratricopeptide (TPR) repeat protein
LKKEPVQSQPRVHLGVSYQTLGEILLDEGNLRGALESCQKSLSILEAEPIRRASAKYLVEGYVGIGDVYLAMRNWKAAKDSYEKCLAGWRELEQGQKLTDQERSKVDEVIQKIEKCNRQMAT